MIITYTDGGYSRQTDKAYGSFVVYRLAALALPDGCFKGVWGVSDDVHIICQSIKPLAVERFDIGHPMGIIPDNSMAEVVSLHTAISWLLCLGYFGNPLEKIHILMDSDQCVKQMTGHYVTHNAALLDIYRSIYRSIEIKQAQYKHRLLDMVKYHWIPNEVMKRSVIGH